MMRIRHLAATAAVLALTAACAPMSGPMGPASPGSGPSNAFSADDFAWSQAPGRNTIVGRLLYRQGTERFSCAGASVVLTPDTPWTRNRMSILYNSPERAALPADEVRTRTPKAPPGDPTPFLRRTTCDAADHFTFSGLPDGGWYVISIARPAAGSGHSVALMRRVVTRQGRMTNVEL